jgi:flagellar biosynthesis chaperone FliJ
MSEVGKMTTQEWIKYQKQIKDYHKKLDEYDAWVKKLMLEKDAKDEQG